jgi:hypothetical protein
VDQAGGVHFGGANLVLRALQGAPLLSPFSQSRLFRACRTTLGLFHVWFFSHPVRYSCTKSFRL